MSQLISKRWVRSQIDWRLCFIADMEALAGMDVLHIIGEAVAGGATIIQLRTKKRDTRAFLGVVMQAAEFLRKRKVPLIINDRVDIVLACDAEGVHLGQTDMPLPYARKIMGKQKIIGISVNTLDEAMAAEKEGADYLGVGPIFPTSSKIDVPTVLGLDGIRKIRGKTDMPLLAIGGINIANVAAVISAGASGVAVISAIAASDHPRLAATGLIEAIGKVALNESRGN